MKQNFNCNTETGECIPEQENHQKESVLVGTKNKKKPKLIYYYDALCGWCYGFSPVIFKLYETYKNSLDIELISGGLFLNNRVGYINDIAPYIKQGAYKSVEITTGVKFGEAFLAVLYGDGKIVLNSLQPSIALCIIKDKYPERQLQFGEMLLKAVYFDGLSANDIHGLAKYAVKIGMEEKDFLYNMKELKYKEMAEAEFTTFKNSSHTGMPTLVLENNDKQHLLAGGYANFETLDARLKKVLNL